ncbi:MAG TPA: ATP synthase subunit I [Stenotrophobium sp.]|nr:ATP synthase subunit I [Stenotrophobium sp.]
MPPLIWRLYGPAGFKPAIGLGTGKLMRRRVYKLLVAQVLLAVAAAVAMYGWRGQPEAAGAAVYGGAIALVNTLLLAWRTARAGAAAEADARWSSIGLLAGLLERFVFTLAAFGVGMGVLRLFPPALLVGFAAAQMAYVFARPGHPVGGVQGRDKEQRGSGL